MSVVIHEKIDLSRNKRQGEYFNAVMSACAGLNEHRFFGYGGAVRGGKTSVTLFLLILLSHKYPNSRWHTIRDTLPSLKKTTIPSIEKFLPENGWTAHRDGGDYYYEYVNGSRIYMMPESITRDPELKAFLGLETNGIFLEQAEELSPLMWEKAKERTGSWYIDPMPPGLIFLTVNPTYTWSRRIFYEPWRNGTLPGNMFFMSALPSDNPFVTADQWAAWSDMEPEMYDRFIKGDWDFDNQKNLIYNYGSVQDIFSNSFIPRTGVKYITADPAYGGADDFVIGVWDDWVLFDVSEYKKTASTDVTSIIRKTAHMHGVPARRICFDATGSGEHLKGDLAGAIPFVGASAAVDTEPNKTPEQKAANRKPQYANLRAQCFFRSGRRVEDCGMFFDTKSLHLQEKVTEEMLAIRKADTKEGAPMLIIPKEDIIANIKRSPGYADIISMREYFDLLPYKQRRARQMRAG